VVVPLHDSARYLARTVPAILAQDLAAQWVFVDDGSADGCADVLESLLADATPAAAGATYQLVHHDRNRGRAAARNTGRAHAHGEVIVFLDADMEPAPDFLRAHALVHNAPGVAGAVSAERWGDLDPSDPYHQYLARYRRGPGSLRADRAVPARLFIIGYTSVRRTALDEVGGFDEGIPYGEDTDLAVRLATRFPGGLRFAPDARVTQYGAPNLDAALAKWRRFGRASVPLLLTRHPSLARDLGGDLARPDTLRGALGSVVLRDAPAALLRRALPAIPPALRPFAVRYLVAEAVVSGFRSSLAADAPTAVSAR
jgi:glycosyltransferase involved in cell wall biosynthesis